MIKYEDLTRAQKDEIVDWYKEHTYSSTENKFNISRKTLWNVVDEYGLEKHSRGDLMKFGCREKYGVDNITQSEYYKNKIKNRTKEEVNKSTEKRKATNRRKYGYDHALQVPEIQQKFQDTCQEKYGSTNFATSEGFAEYQRAAYMKKFGVTHNMKLQEFKDQYRNTCLKKYGVTNYSKSQLFKNQVRQDTIDGYSSEEFKRLFDDREACIEFLKNNQIPICDLADYFQTTHPTIETWIYRNNLRDYITHVQSHYENDIKKMFPNFIKHDRKALGNGQEIDLYDPELKVGIEFNGDYWHSSCAGIDPNYHQDKSILAEKRGIRLIHIYEYEWNDSRKRPIIESLINIAIGNVPSHIYARNCEIRVITNKEARLFNEQNHLQGHRNATITYGLFYNNNLVQLMSFSKTRYNKNLKNENDWEIIRGCPGSNNIVVGGVGKLFKHFIKEHNPDKIFSYCDFNKFDGKSYEAIGMKFIGYTAPDLKWIVNGKVVNRNPSKHKELKEAAQGTIQGSGSKKYVWVKEENVHEIDEPNDFRRN